MANFKYRAISLGGEKVNGVIEATDQLDAVAKIKQSCSVIEEIQEIQVREQGISKVKKVNAKTLSLMCSRFSLILGVGLPIVNAVDMLAGQMEDKNFAALLHDVSKDVAMGRNLSSAFAARDGVFPVTFLETIRSGEESGDLVEAFRRLSIYYEKSSKTRQKVTSALVYPAFVMVVAVVVMGIIMTVGVPSFAKSYASMGSELPAITKMVIGMSNFITNYGMLVLCLIVACAFAALRFNHTEKGTVFFSSTALKIPIMGKIIQLSAAAQFAHTMSMMLSAGMPILKCIDTAGKSVNNYVMRRDILGTTVSVEGGHSLGACLAKSAFLPPMLIEMTKMGEATGTLESTLESVGNFYDNEVEVSTAKALSILEPAIICVLAVFVVIILFSVYLPMFGMYGGV